MTCVNNVIADWLTFETAQVLLLSMINGLIELGKESLYGILPGKFLFITKIFFVTLQECNFPITDNVQGPLQLESCSQNQQRSKSTLKWLKRFILSNLKYFAKCGVTTGNHSEVHLTHGFLFFSYYHQFSKRSYQWSYYHLSRLHKSDKLKWYT